MDVTSFIAGILDQIYARGQTVHALSKNPYGPNVALDVDGYPISGPGAPYTNEQWAAKHALWLKATDPYTLDLPKVLTADNIQGSPEYYKPEFPLRPEQQGPYNLDVLAYLKLLQERFTHPTETIDQMRYYNQTMMNMLDAIDTKYANGHKIILRSQYSPVNGWNDLMK